MIGPRNPHDLFEALERNEIVPYFQPLVELRSGILTGFEVLARWIHPVDGVISPDRFIPMAEETGCIGELTERLLHHVFASAGVIPPQVSLSVNISPLQFRDSKLARHIDRMARAGGFPAERIVLEVTESALMGNIMQARAIAGELKELGVRLALDDFGTGYSSLRHLQALPFDELKVDAGFVRSMGVTLESRKIAAAVVGLGQSLGLRTVAEGVETRNQAEMLLWLGCDEAQGWLYGRPVPAEKLAEIVSRETLLGDDQADEQGICGPIMPRIEALPSQRLAHLQAIYDGVPAGLCFLDRSLRFLSINRRLADINGRSVADHLGRRLQDVLPTLWPDLEPLMRRVLDGESIHGFEYWDRRLGPALPHRVFSMSYEPARDEAGEVVGVSVALVDISEQRHAELRLQELKSLRELVAQLEFQLGGLKLGAPPIGFAADWQSASMTAD
jgi:PAS domain S-box-containing protein